MKIKAVCEIKFHDILGENDFSELLKYGADKIKINGKVYYISEVKKDCVSFIELNKSEHEIEIGDPMFNRPTTDIVKVVRCKDCEVYDEYTFCEHMGMNGFCSYGERKENEQ